MQLALNSRVAIEQAKGALARAQSLTMPEAYNLIRSTAQSAGRTLSEVAHSVIADLEPADKALLEMNPTRDTAAGTREHHR